MSSPLARRAIDEEAPAPAPLQNAAERGTDTRLWSQTYLAELGPRLVKSFAELILLVVALVSFVFAGIFDCLVWIASTIGASLWNGWPFNYSASEGLKILFFFIVAALLIVSGSKALSRHGIAQQPTSASDTIPTVVFLSPIDNCSQPGVRKTLYEEFNVSKRLTCTCIGKRFNFISL
ncbi:hypothetical protein CALCODRAFT_506414 [Calocera cornea HHB12733]|uniref:Uncharacterized protein n=1 Tax=Calocera cornea HHB12733 TaxID=1353952 RepID=A0A165J0J1_9BASI|nr:hypothetical protein CALCODRAFT_506414 [Calocera cornea HHB12733]